MNYSLANKDVSISGKTIITDWRQIRVVSPKNLQEKIKANENGEQEIRNQKEIFPMSSNIIQII